VEITPTADTLVWLCDSRQFTAVVKDSAGNTIAGAPITWGISPQNVATIDSTGLVRPLSNGMASVTAATDSASTSAQLTIAFATPTAVAMQSLTWDNGYPRLTWAESTDTLLCAYVVNRNGNWGDWVSTIGEGQDSIFDRATTTYLDTTMSQIYGMKLNYRILVANGSEFVESDSMVIEFGSTVALARNPDVRPILNPSGDEMYLLEDPSDTLKAVSTATGAVLRNRWLLFANRVAMSKDGSKLFVVQVNRDSVHVLDTGTFGTTASERLNFSGSGVNAIVAGRPDRLYMTSFDFLTQTSVIKIVDANTLAEMGEIGVDVENGLLAISPDNDTLYAAQSDTVYKIDVSTDVAQVLDTALAGHDIRFFQLSPDGSRLYLGHVYGPPSNFVDVWDAETLTSLGQIQVLEQHFDFFVTHATGILFTSPRRSSSRNPIRRCLPSGLRRGWFRSIRGEDDQSSWRTPKQTAYELALAQTDLIVVEKVV
jgi:DNA-binding beta-propeller fold protein YncE